MGAGNLVVAFDTPENREVLADTGLFFETREALTERLSDIVADPSGSAFQHLRATARARAETEYSWDAITRPYEDLFMTLRRPR